ncbi:MAG: CCA tRNA nucleotidyltransferase [Rhizobiales bacterium]|nr:CCA tRNA nucleotidyltransferase [Hyphomicrobiales bacterium]
MSDPFLPFLADPRLGRVLDALNGAGEETRAVGGAVRNALLGLPVNDVDLATTALPAETIRRAEAAGLKAVPTGLAHGTVTVVADGTPFEVTTLREDVETDGRHAVVRFGRDWARDAARRDFTMNALFATQAGEVIDLVGGRADLAARKVRFIGDPEGRIREDYLRILRLFRFHAAYGAGEVDPPALSAAIRCREGLAGLSRERVGAEMLKLLGAVRAPSVLRCMSDAGLLVPVLGGVPALGAIERLAEMERALGRAPDALLRLGALAVRIAEDADRLHERLRLSNAAHQRLRSMARPGIDLPMTERALRVQLYEMGAGEVVDRALLAAARNGEPAALDALRDLIATAQAWVPPTFPVRARHLQALGMEAGPALGQALARAKQAWIAADFPDGEAVALDLARRACAASEG